MLRRRLGSNRSYDNLSRWEPSAGLDWESHAGELPDLAQQRNGAAAPGFAGATDLPACREPALAFRLLCDASNGAEGNQVHLMPHDMIHFAHAVRLSAILPTP